MTKSETQKYVCELRTEIASLEENVGYYKDSISRVEKNCDKLYHENKELKQITKGYEDKIAELKKDYKTASELLGKYQQENESLKKRVVELENFSCQAEQETESLVEKLNQRIVKLEKSRSEWIDKTVEWQQKCEKLEIKEAENTVCVRVSASPIEIATHLINNTCTINELKMIAEHINVYCNGGK